MPVVDDGVVTTQVRRQGQNTRTGRDDRTHPLPATREQRLTDSDVD